MSLKEKRESNRRLESHYEFFGQPYERGTERLIKFKSKNKLKFDPRLHECLKNLFGNLPEFVTT